VKLDALLIEKYGKKGAEKMKSQFSVSELKKMFGAEDDKEEVQLVKLVGPQIEVMKGEKGDTGAVGPRGPIGPRGERGQRGEKGERGRDGRDGVDGKDGEVGKDGRDGKDAVVDYKRVVRETLDKIPKPKDGKTPKHEWDGKKLRFENPDGTWGEWVDLSPVQTGKSRLLGSISVPTFVDRETPTGSTNGVNKVFTTVHTPSTNSLLVFLDGQLQDENDDYTFSGTTITFTNPPQENSKVRVNYRYE